VVAGVIPAAKLRAKISAKAEPSHPAPAPVHRRARRGGEKQQIDDDPVPF
jgi:hypothetical protein